MAATKFLRDEIADERESCLFYDETQIGTWTQMLVYLYSEAGDVALLLRGLAEPARGPGIDPQHRKSLGVMAQICKWKTGGSAVPGHPQLRQFESRRLYISSDPKFLLYRSPCPLCEREWPGGPWHCCKLQHGVWDDIENIVFCVAW